MPHTQALLVGISFRGSNKALKGCAPDMVNIERYLGRIGVTDITVLDDTRRQPHDPLYPTRDNFLRTLKAAVDTRQPGDSLFVHLSSHGFFIKDKAVLFTEEGDSIDAATTQCLLLRSPAGHPSHNNIGVNNTVCDVQITQILATVRPGVRVFLLGDICHAGILLELPLTYQYTRMGRFVEEERPLAPKVPPGVVLMIGVRNKKYAEDAEDENGDTYGAFTSAILDLLTEARTGKTQITYFTLLSLVQKRLGRVQDPQLAVGDKASGEAPIWLI